MPPESLAAFFSYCRDDSDFALRLAEDLKAAGASVWLDQIDITPGQRWDRSVEDALTNCPRLLVILSPASVNSTNVQDEVSFALEAEKTVVPVLYRDCVIPFRLRRVQYVDFRTDPAGGLKALLKTLGVQRPEQTASAFSPPPVESQPGVFPPEERQLAATQALMEQAVGKVRPEADQEREQQAAAEQVHLEQQQCERLATAAHLEQEKRGQPEQERRGGSILTEPSGSFSRSPAWMKITLAASGVLVAALVLYLAARPSEKKGEIPKQELKTETYNPPTPDKGSSDRAAADNPAADKAAADKIVADKTAADKGTAGKIAGEKTAADKAMRNKIAAEKTAADKADAGRRIPLSAVVMLARGDDYYSGKSVPKDYQQAATSYRIAADAGSTKAMVNLGFMYVAGDLGQVDYQQAATWWRKAAEAGNAGGMVSLGRLYETGNGVKQDYAQAVTWYRKAAGDGEVTAMEYLGSMYETGRGVGKDYQQAVSWYRKAGQLGEDDLKRLGETSQ